MSRWSEWASAYTHPPLSRLDLTELTMRKHHHQFVERAIEQLPRRES